MDDEGDMTDWERCLPHPEIQSRQPVGHEGHCLTFTGDNKDEGLKSKEHLGKLVDVRFIMDYLMEAKDLGEENISDLWETDIVEGNCCVLFRRPPVVT